MRELKHLRGSRVVARDGAAGVLHDLLFDAAQWKVRQLAVDRGAGITIDRLLVPAAYAALADDGTIHVARKRQQFGPRPGARSAAWLVSGRETTRYSIRAADGPAGELDDLLIAKSWSIAGVAIGLFTGSRVKVDAPHIVRIERKLRVVQVRLTRAQILNLPRLSSS
jgi:hypothetical protein